MHVTGLEADFGGRFIVRFSRPSKDVDALARQLATRRGGGLGDWNTVERFVTSEPAWNNPLQAQLQPQAFSRSNDVRVGLLIEEAYFKSWKRGSRFNPEKQFGGLYLAYDRVTATEEVNFHWEDRCNRFPDLAEGWSNYHGVEVEISTEGKFLDLRKLGRAADQYPNFLNENPTDGYPNGQQLGEEMYYYKGIDGIIYHSARHEGGTCLVLYDLQLVLRFRWTTSLRLPRPDADTTST